MSSNRPPSRISQTNGKCHVVESDMPVKVAKGISTHCRMIRTLYSKITLIEDKNVRIVQRATVRRVSYATCFRILISETPA